MSLLPAKYRTRPWSWRRDAEYLANIRAACAADGHARGIYFDTGGNARIEILNPDAEYGYLWRSDRDG